MDDRYAIQLARTEIREGYESADVDRILNIYADDVGDMSAGEPSLSGAEAKAVLRARLHGMFAKFRVRSAPAGIDILLFGESALDYGWQELILSPRTGGTAVRIRTRYMSLWKKQSSGRWRIALWMDNPDEQPTLAADRIARIQAGFGAFPEQLEAVAELGGEALEQALTEA